MRDTMGSEEQWEIGTLSRCGQWGIHWARSKNGGHRSRVAVVTLGTVDHWDLSGQKGTLRGGHSRQHGQWGRGQAGRQ